MKSWDPAPLSPMDKQIDTTENITFPQTAVVNLNYYFSEWKKC